MDLLFNLITNSVTHSTSLIHGSLLCDPYIKKSDSKINRYLYSLCIHIKNL